MTLMERGEGEREGVAKAAGFTYQRFGPFLLAFIHQRISGHRERKGARSFLVGHFYFKKLPVLKIEGNLVNRGGWCISLGGM